MSKYQKTPKPDMASQTIYREPGTLDKLTNVSKYPVAKIRLEVAGLSIQDLVKGSGNMKPQGKTDIRIRFAQLIRQQPSSVGTGKLHFVPVSELKRRRYRRFNRDILYQADMFDGFLQMLPFIFQLLIIFK